jgi:hypothetical protein
MVFRGLATGASLHYPDLLTTAWGPRYVACQAFVAGWRKTSLTMFAFSLSYAQYTLFYLKNQVLIS